MNELTVILKDPHRTCGFRSATTLDRQKFLMYESYTASDQDSAINTCIEEARKNFEGEPENIQIKIHMEIQ